MYGTESHDGLLCKISNLHSPRGGGGAKTPRGGEFPTTPLKKTCNHFQLSPCMFSIYIDAAQSFPSHLVAV